MSSLHTVAEGVTNNSERIDRLREESSQERKENRNEEHVYAERVERTASTRSRDPRTGAACFRIPGHGPPLRREKDHRFRGLLEP